MPKLVRVLKWAGIAALAAFFAATVWPTPYRWDHIGLGQGSSYPVRISRFTGCAEMLRPPAGVSNKGGWVQLGNGPWGRAGMFDDLLP